MRTFVVGLLGLAGTIVLGLVVTPFEPSLYAFMFLLGIAAGAVGRDRRGAASAAAGALVGLSVLFVADVQQLVLSFWSVSWEDFSNPEFPGLAPLLVLIPVSLVVAEIAGYAAAARIARGIRGRRLRQG